MVDPRGIDRQRDTPSTTRDERGSATRRGLLTSLVTLLLAGTVTSRYLVESVRADAAVSGLSVAGDQITTDNGQLTSLTASVSGHVSYDGLDGQAATVEVRLFAAPAGGAVDAARNQIATTSASVDAASGLDTRAGHHDFDFVDVDVLAADDLSTTDFAATGDGTTKDTDVEFRLGLAVLDAGGSELVGAAQTATATISVTNESRQGGAQGNGNTNAQGTNQSP
jgi:hypothetical protein